MSCGRVNRSSTKRQVPSVDEPSLPGQDETYLLTLVYITPTRVSVIITCSSSNQAVALNISVAW